jgi:hypothetical protein
VYLNPVVVLSVPYSVALVRETDSQQQYAYKVYRDATRWWNIADVNPQVFYPLDLIILGDGLRVRHEHGCFDPQVSSAINGVLIDGQLHDLLVAWASGTFKENEHGSMSLFVSTSTRATDYGIMPGQRIEFDFGTRGNTQKFQGYVSAVTPQRRLNGTKVISEQEIQCLGESMVLKGNHPRFFTEVTSTQAIARIVAESNLGFSDEFRRDDTTWRTLAQTSETDWEMIVNLATRIGAHVLVTKGVVRLLDYTEIMARVLPIRVYTKRQQSPPTPSS